MLNRVLRLKMEVRATMIELRNASWHFTVDDDRSWIDSSRKQCNSGYAIAAKHISTDITPK
jgi:hypothetical protein